MSCRCRPITAMTWRALLMQAGAEFGVVPYGVEALSIMRIEKGHVAGGELNGTTTPDDLGLGRMMSRRKDYIGRMMGEREGAEGRQSRRAGGSEAGRARRAAARRRRIS